MSDDNTPTEAAMLRDILGARAGNPNLFNVSRTLAYAMGHREARHQAVEIVSAAFPAIRAEARREAFEEAVNALETLADDFAIDPTCSDTERHEQTGINLGLYRAAGIIRDLRRSSSQEDAQ